MFGAVLSGDLSLSQHLLIYKTVQGCCRVYSNDLIWTRRKAFNFQISQIELYRKELDLSVANSNYVAICIQSLGQKMIRLTLFGN
jgi:hypothetical protein